MPMQILVVSEKHAVFYTFEDCTTELDDMPMHTLYSHIKWKITAVMF